jgi:hypothetical protein
VLWCEFDGRYLMPEKDTQIRMNNLRLGFKNPPSIESFWDELIDWALSEADDILATAAKDKAQGKYIPC